MKEYKIFLKKIGRGLVNVPDLFKNCFGILYSRSLPIVAGRQSGRYPDRAKKLYYYIVGNYKNSETQYTPYNLGSNFVYKTSLIEFTTSADFSWKEEELNFIDDEVFFSLNRWYWLLYDQKIVREIEVDKITELLHHWIRCNSYNPEAKSWEPYSCGERISTLAMIYSLKENKERLHELSENDSVIRNFLKVSIAQIGQNLEYFYDGVTFNHVINNLKGLIVAGMLLNDKKLVDLAFEVLLKELDEVFDCTGILREGSSHYQLIVTRWICELEYHLKEFQLEDHEKLVLPWRLKLVNGIRFFLVKRIGNHYSIPLFGDVSPDFSVDWIIHYYTRGENDSISYGHRVAKVLQMETIRQSESIPRDPLTVLKSFSRIEKNNWTIFIRHGSVSPEYFPSHSHNDYASYTLFVSGFPVCIDPGRINYFQPALADPYCAAAKHNCSLVNDEPLSLGDHYYYLPGLYKKNNFRLAYENSEQIEFCINTEDVKHIPNIKTISAQKKFIVTDSCIVVEENFISKGTVLSVNSNLNFSSMWTIGESAGNFDIRSKRQHLILKVTEKVDEINYRADIASPDYLVAEKMTSFHLTKKANNRVCLKYEIHLIS